MHLQLLVWQGQDFLCCSPRCVWQKSKAQVDDAEEPSYISEMDDVLGARYCEPSKMKPAERYNDVEKSTLQLCVQGTFIPDGSTGWL